MIISNFESNESSENKDKSNLPHSNMGKNYRNRENLEYCAKRKLRLSGPDIGRPKKDEVCEKITLMKRSALKLNVNSALQNKNAK